MVETGANTTAKTSVPMNKALYGLAVRSTLPSNKKSILFLLISAIDKRTTILMDISLIPAAKVARIEIL